MRRRGWGVLVGAAVLVAGLSACRGGGNDPAVQGATVPTAAPTTTTTNPYAVPEVIDEAYVNRVLAALDAALGDAFRLFVEQREITPEIEVRLAAIYQQPSPYDLVIRNLENSLDLAPAQAVGDRITVVAQMISAGPTCIYVEVRRDFRPMGFSDLHDDQQWVGLTPAATPAAVPAYNPTSWVMSVDGFQADRSRPPNPCESS